MNSLTSASELSSLSFDDSFVRSLPGDPNQLQQSRAVSKALYSFVKPVPVKNPKLLAWSDPLAQTLGISRPPPGTSPSLEALAGNRVLPGMKPYAARYGGHQFGHWAGQLGDGRAMTLGEVVDARAQRWDIQLKGAGGTPYSRRADGRAVLRSSVREFLCSEAMHHLGIPTTRALALVTSEDQVLRDMFYDGRAAYETLAIVTRVAPSFIRFGSFQILTSADEIDELRQLADYVIEQHFPTLDRSAPDVYGAWYRDVCRRTALMVAHWQRVGFVHGVMNTDNMSILGLTIDYGPYGWLDVYDPNWTPNTTDATHRRYRFAQQPGICLWNLAQLGQALLPLLGNKEEIEAGLDIFRKDFSEIYSQMMAHKLGFTAIEPGDFELFAELEAMLELTPTDMTIFFRNLASIDLAAPSAAHLEILSPAYYKADELSSHRASIEAWLDRYAERSRRSGLHSEARKELMNKTNPKYVLRNYLSQEAIDAADQGDARVIERLLHVMQKPYDEQPEWEALAGRRPDWAENKPGCSALSCSS